MNIYFQFRQVLLHLMILVSINIAVFISLCMIPLVQMIAWEEELKNITNSTIVIQYQPIQSIIIGCEIVTLFILLVLFISITEVNKAVKSFRQITWKKWLFLVCFVIIFIVICDRIIIPSQSFGMFINNICKKIAYNTIFGSFSSSTPPEHGYLPLQMYYSCLCLICVTILFNSQHIIIIVLIHKIRPQNFDSFQTYNCNNNCSKSSHHSSTVQSET